MKLYHGIWSVLVALHYGFLHERWFYVMAGPGNWEWMYKLELETSKQIESSNKLETDNYRTREHDREMKKLKEKVEDLVDELRSKELKLSDLEVANAELQADIKLTRTKTQAEGMQKCEELMQERSALRRELDSVSSDFKFYKNK